MNTINNLLKHSTQAEANAFKALCDARNESNPDLKPGKVAYARAIITAQLQTIENNYRQVQRLSPKPLSTDLSYYFDAMLAQVTDYLDHCY